MGSNPHCNTLVELNEHQWFCCSLAPVVEAAAAVDAECVDTSMAGGLDTREVWHDVTCRARRCAMQPCSGLF